MKPSIGRIVHYMARGSLDRVYPPVCRAAIITQVDEWYELRKEITATIAQGMELPEDMVTNLPGAVGLCVLNPSGMFFHESIDYDEAKAPGSWHWPERVDDDRG